MREYYPDFLKFIDDALEMARNIPKYFSKYSNKIYCNRSEACHIGSDAEIKDNKPEVLFLG